LVCGCVDKAARGLSYRFMEASAPPGFSQDWFSRSIPAWQRILSALSRGGGALRILEVGVFEGLSTCWLLRNFCKSPESAIVAVDSFQGGEEHRGLELGDLRQRFERNVAAVGSPARVEVRQGESIVQLAAMVASDPPPEFDFISVDASHRACDVLGDAVLAFRLLRPGGVLAFDDYLWNPFRRGGEDVLSTPKVAVDAFTSVFARQARVLPHFPLYQLYVQKTIRRGVGAPKVQGFQRRSGEMPDRVVSTRNEARDWPA